MKKLLLMMKPKPGETAEQFAKRYWEALKPKLKKKNTGSKGPKPAN